MPILAVSLVEIRGTADIVMPSLDQRMKHCAGFHHGPSSAGTARHSAPFWCRHTIALIVWRRCCGGTFAAGRQISISGSSTAHCSSVSIRCPSKRQHNATSTGWIQALTSLTGPSENRGRSP